MGCFGHWWIGIRYTYVIIQHILIFINLLKLSYLIFINARLVTKELRVISPHLTYHLHADWHLRPWLKGHLLINIRKVPPKKYPLFSFIKLGFFMYNNLLKIKIKSKTILWQYCIVHNTKGTCNTHKLTILSMFLGSIFFCLISLGEGVNGFTKKVILINFYSSHN